MQISPLAVSTLAGVTAATAAALLLVLLPDLLDGADRSGWRPSVVKKVQAAAIDGSSVLPPIRLAHMGRHFVVLDDAQRELRCVSLVYHTSMGLRTDTVSRLCEHSCSG
jgi:hypothetical protein